MQDPQYRLYLLKRQFSLDGPQSIGIEELLELVEVLPAEDVNNLLLHFSRAKCEAATNLIAQVAKSDLRTEIRNKALSLIAQSSNGRNEYCQLFQDALQKTSSDFVSATAVKALGGTNEDLTFGLFKKYLTHSDGRVRANCIEGLRYRTVPGLRPILELLLDDPSPRVRAEAALSLWKMGNPVILQLLADAEDPHERISYIRTLGRTGASQQVIDLLWEFYRGDNEDEAAAAAESLLQLEPDNMIPRIVGMAVYGPSAFRKRLFDCCVTQDKNFVVAELVKQIRDLLADGRSTHSRSLATAISLLNRTGEVGDVDLLVACVDSEDARVAANAIEALESRKEAPNVRAALIRCLRLGTPRMRVNAAVVLWKTGLVAAVSELKDMLEDDEATIRAGGVYGLGTIGGIVVNDSIMSMLSDPAEGVRRMAARFIS